MKLLLDFVAPQSQMAPPLFPHTHILTTMYNLTFVHKHKQSGKET